ncbi:hypothetical protein [Pantoea septica]|uniref:hypothetical protein n=1 Tax=Pantoea septica TaxID=472695 RepID=UPI0028A90939|nr:hypothetical protein [Pantoea septica]
MTFIELDAALGKTGRRSLALRLVFALADALDNERSGLDLDEFEKQSGYIRTNIRAVASALKELNVIDIYYYADNVTGDGHQVKETVSRGRWSKQHYRLSNAVRKLLKREQ